MKYTFSGLIGVAKVQRLNDLFYTATGIPAAILDPEGAIITCSGWQEICTKFHRVNEGTARQCVESDTVLANRIGVGRKYTVYKCGNGLVVAASPVIVGDEHAANFVTSQFLFHPPDRDSFLEQAKRFGFDEAAYMEAAGKIPVIDESKLPPILEYFSEFAALLGEMGLKQLKQLEATAGLRESEQRWASTLSSVGDAVIAADEEWALTFDSVPDMIAIIDAEHRILRVNSAMARRLGRKAEECVGVHCYEAVHGLSAPPFFCPHSRSLKDGGQHIEEVTEDRLGGCFLVSTTPLRVPGEPIMRTVHVVRDITERKRVEEALRESQRQMNRAQEIAHLGSWELDLVNNRLSWSDEVYRIFGLQPQEFGATYDAFLEAVHPEDRQAVDAAYSGSLREGRDTYEIEHRVVRRPSGEIRIVHEKCEHLRDETGRIVKSVGMVHDITEHKRVEQELREARAELERKVAERTAELRRSEAYLNEAQRMSHTGSWAYDPNTGELIHYSGELLRIYGLDEQEMEAGKRVHPEDRQRTQERRQKAFHEKTDYVDEYRIVLPDGTIKHVHVIGHPVLNEAGQIIEFVGTSVDVTERKRVEEALQNLMADLESRVEERTKELSAANQSLEAANRELESFSYSVSHDLRAPLRAIDGFSKMVLKGYADRLDDEGRRKLNVIRSNAQQMDQLINDLLAFSRLGRKEMVQVRFEMEALVQSAWKELTLVNPDRRIRFSVQGLPDAMGDQTLIKVAVANLLSNAVKFTKHRENAILEVGAYPEKEINVYFVKDNGVGFDMQYYDKLFGVFQRLHSADEFEGTGVGLAIVERIIHRHGGRVWAEGKEGEGAAFYFTLAKKE